MNREQRHLKAIKEAHKDKMNELDMEHRRLEELEHQDAYHEYLLNGATPGGME